MPPPPPDTLAQLRDLVGLVRDLAPPATPAPAPTVKVVHEDRDPPLPSDAPPLMVVLDRIAGVVDKALDRREAAAAAPPPASPEAAAVQVPLWLVPFMGYLPQLVELADAGHAPELVAQSIASKLTPEHLEALEPVLTHDGFPSSIVGMIPHLEQRKTWAVPFLYALRAAVPSVAKDVTDDEESETA